MRRRLATFLFLCAALAARDAAADPTPDAIARADALFTRGKAEMAAGEHAAACVLFNESYQLDPSDGTLLALGLCHEQEGRLLVAYSELRDVHAASVKSGREDRQRVALTALARVQPKIGRLASSGKSCAGLEVDGKEVPPGEATSEKPYPVTPGAHRIACPGGAPANVTVDAGALEIVALAPAAAVAAPPRPPPPAPPAAPETGAGRTVAWILGAAGVASLGVGTFFGVRAFSQWSDVENKCNPAACRNRSARGDENEARDSATIANVTLVAGAALLAAAVYFFATSRSAPKSAAAW